MENIIPIAIGVYFMCIILANTRVLSSKRGYIDLTYSSPLSTMFIIMLYWIIVLKRDINGITIGIASTLVLIVIFYRYIKKIKKFAIYNIKDIHEKDIMNIIKNTTKKHKVYKQNILFKKCGITYKIIFKNCTDSIIQECMKEVSEYIEGNKKSIFYLCFLYC